jgi:hypothetical protein
MGTWGAGSFQNDSALDWVGDFCKRSDISLVHAALSRVVEHGGTKQSSASFIEKLFGRRRRSDWLTANVASQALAAAEVVAAWDGRPSANLPDNLVLWLQQHESSFQPDLVPKARQAVSIVKTNSELKDLWEEGDAVKWKAAIKDLEQRLGSPAAQ